MPRVIKNTDTNILIVFSLILLTIRELTNDASIKVIAIIKEALIFTYPFL